MTWVSSWGLNAPWSASVFETLGRALFAAQEFEEKCRYLLRMLNLVEAFESAPGDPLESLVARVPKDKMLGQTIKALNTMHENDEDIVKILETATKARNFVAHESAHFHPRGHRADAVARIDLRLRPALKDLAVGDHWASKLVLALEDWEAVFAIGWIEKAYPDILESWVLYPMKDHLAAEGAAALPYPVSDPWFAARHAADVALAERMAQNKNAG